MRSTEHPNARWLHSVYSGASDIRRNDGGLPESTVDKASEEHITNTLQRFSPDFILHTGGHQLAATGDRRFLHSYSSRRRQLSLGTFRTIEILEVVADDRYGLVTGRFQANNGVRELDMIGMGAWRFADGMATEHWEMPDAREWDDFFLAVDPLLSGEGAEEYWLRG